MDRTNITNVLLVVILWILLKQFYPATADTLLTLAIVASVLYCCYWLVTQFPGQWKKRKAERKQEAEDERAYWEYRQKHDAIRAKYDPRNEWNEATSVPYDYSKEIIALNLEYRGVLQRRNGWTAADFSEYDN